MRKMAKMQAAGILKKEKTNKMKFQVKSPNQNKKKQKFIIHLNNRFKNLDWNNFGCVSPKQCVEPIWVRSVA